MPFELFSKSVIAPAAGVNKAIEPHVLTDKQWYRFEGMRARRGVVSCFPGVTLSNDHTSSYMALYKFITNTQLSRVLMDSNDFFEFDGATLTDRTAAVVFLAGEGSVSFVTYNGVLYFVNGGSGGVYKWTGPGTDITLIATSPPGQFITAFFDHLIVLDKITLSWCNEIDDATWTPSATNDAGSFSFTDTEELFCAHILGSELIIYRRNNISALSFLGGDLVFLHKPLIQGMGAVGKNAVQSVNDRHYVMGREFFYSYQGGNSVDLSMGYPINDAVYAELNPAKPASIHSYTLPGTQEIIWSYETITSTRRLVVYNYLTGVWMGPFTLAAPVHGFANRIIRDDLLAGFDFISGDDVGAFQADLIGDQPQTRYMETGDIFLGLNAVSASGETVNFPFKTMFRLESVNLETLDIMNAAINFSVGMRKDLNDAITWTGPFSVKSFNSQAIRVPVRCSGRWARLKFDLPADVLFTLCGYQLYFTPMGTR